ncbi:MAG: HAD family hydrolase, partial [Aquabacterium sp.]
MPSPSRPATATSATPWWETPLPALLQGLQAGPSGLTQEQAAARLAAQGPNSIAEVSATTPLRLLARQFASPLVLILAAGAFISLALRDWSDALTILVIVASSAGLGFWQEWRASQALERLRTRLALTVQVRRDGQPRRLPAAELVPGDIVELCAGNLVPADGVLLQARDFLVSQAGLTGESFPVEKRPGPPVAGAALAQRHHAVFLGSSVCSGTATILVAATGTGTVMAEIARHLGTADEETEFESGVRRFGELLLKLMFAVVLAVLLVNQALQRPLVESAMFAVALAVGLSPELLPAIVSVSLARGARLLAAQGVLVRRLDAIEDLGGMDTLCTDKTGTLTEGRMTLAFATDADGEASPQVLHAAWLNASFETGIDNPIDAALVQAGSAAGLSTQDWRKIDEIPYDFARRRLTVAAARDADPSTHLLVTKGAFAQVLEACDRVLDGTAERPLDAAARDRLEAQVRRHAERGVRVLAVAWDRRSARPRWEVADETGLLFAGFLGFVDPPKGQAADTVRDLAARGVQVKMVTGDNRHVAAHVAQQVGLDASALLTGETIAGLRDE